MAINIYETMTMLEMINNSVEPFSFFMDVFFPIERTFPTEKVLVDIKKNGRKMAPLVSKYANGVLDKRGGYKTDELNTPFVAPIRVLTAADLATRKAGENVIGGKTPAQRALEYFAEDTKELQDKHINTREYLASKVLLGESIDIDEVDRSGKVVGKFNIDYGFENVKTVKAAEKFNATDADPEQVLEDYIDKYLEPKGNVPGIIVLDAEAGKAFKNNAQIKEKIKLFAQAGQLRLAEYKGKGVTYLGEFTKYNIPVYIYSNYMDQGTGKATQLIPSGTAIMGPVGEGFMNYGAITQTEDGVNWQTYEGKEVPLYTPDIKNQVTEYRLASRPLPSPADIDGFMTLKGLV